MSSLEIFLLILRYSLVLIASYFMGNINFAVIIARLKRRDIRKEGSGNPGTMNMLRSVGVKAGAVTLALDALKGAIPAVLGWWILGDAFSFGGSRIGLYSAGLAAILGHIFPVFMRFKGGKGVATMLGILLVANPIAAGIGFAVCALSVIFLHYGSISCFFMLFPAIAAEGFIYKNIYYSLFLFVFFIIIFAAHRQNIFKLIGGRENKVNVFKRKNKAKS